MPIGSLNRPQQLRALRGEMLPPTQQLADRRIGRGDQRLSLLGVQASPLGLVARGHKRALLAWSSHARMLRRRVDRPRPRTAPQARNRTRNDDRRVRESLYRLGMQPRLTGNWTPEGKAERAALRRDYLELTPAQRMLQVFELSKFMSQVSEAGRRQRGA